ncbi:hypothetical protein HDU91_004170, partial [Kappamyces sp. JEL0680]
STWTIYMIELVLLVSLCLGLFQQPASFEALARRQHLKERSSEPAPVEDAAIGMLPWRYFTQPRDHFHAGDNHTWDQLYAYNDAYYTPGGPAILYISGEGPLGPDPINGSALYRSLDGALAKRYGGIHFLVEHRYYGDNTSIPVGDADLTDPKNLQWLNARQALADLAYFAKTFSAKAKILNGTTTLPRSTKWILVGGSYAGNLAAWGRKLYPDLFYAAHSSSGPVLAQEDFWQYGDQVEK